MTTAALLARAGLASPAPTSRLRALGGPATRLVLALLALAWCAAPVRAGEFSEDWFWGKPADRAAHNALVGKPAPPLSITRWHGEPVDIAAQRGKVVVVDLWATWCGPCMRAIPKNNALVKEFSKDVVLVGVHDARRGHDRIDAVRSQHSISYPVGVDSDGRTARAYALAFWPTYAVIDRRGIVRAVGLKPEHVRDVVVKLIAEPAGSPAEGGAGTRPAPPAAPAPPAGGAKAAANGEASWLEGSSADRARLRALERSATPPPLPVGTTWINSEALTLESLRGKVVLLDFWATWCGPCRTAAPKLDALMKKHAGDGLVVIGVCASRGQEKMRETVAALGVSYPIVADDNDAMGRAYGVNGYPDYTIIDRAGKLRIVDCANGKVEEAVLAILAEVPPA